MLVQVNLCRTCSETTLLVFPRGDSNIRIYPHLWIRRFSPKGQHLSSRGLIVYLIHNVFASGLQEIIIDHSLTASCELAPLLHACFSGEWLDKIKADMLKKKYKKIKKKQ